MLDNNGTIFNYVDLPSIVCTYWKYGESLISYIPAGQPGTGPVPPARAGQRANVERGRGNTLRPFY